MFTRGYQVKFKNMVDWIGSDNLDHRLSFSQTDSGHRTSLHRNWENYGTLRFFSPPRLEIPLVIFLEHQWDSPPKAVVAN